MTKKEEESVEWRHDMWKRWRVKIKGQGRREIKIQITSREKITEKCNTSILKQIVSVTKIQLQTIYNIVL